MVLVETFSTIYNLGLAVVCGVLFGDIYILVLALLGRVLYVLYVEQLLMLFCVLLFSLLCT